jgi:hypothetical protein
VIKALIELKSTTSRISVLLSAASLESRYYPQAAGLRSAVDPVFMSLYEECRSGELHKCRAHFLLE